MLNEHVAFFRKVLLFIDLVAIVGSFFLTYHLFHDLRSWYPLDHYLWVLPVLITIWLSLLYFFGIYVSFRLKSAREILWIIFKTVVLGFIVFGSIYFLFKITYLSRSFIILIFLLTTFFITSEKIVILLFFKRLRKMGFNFRNILIVGTGDRARHFMRRVNETPEFGLKIVGIVDDDKRMMNKIIEGHKVIGTFANWTDIICNLTIDHIFFFVPRIWLKKIEEPILFCETVGVPVSIAMNFFDLLFTPPKEGEEFGVPLLTFDSTQGKIGQLIFKRFFDIIFSLTSLIIFLPVFILVAVLVKTTSKGPLFFKQERCTLNGRKFHIYKFRTMVADAEQKLEALRQFNEMTGPAFKIKNDPRLTKVGVYLRKFSLDELPQLWNIFIGNMSIVGPRPPLPQEVEKYEYWQMRKLSMRAGLTCLWQVSGRSKITDFNQWMKLDLEYIQLWSLKLDYKIILKTIPVVIFQKGAR